MNGREARCSKVVALFHCRMDSRRLPGKALVNMGESYSCGCHNPNSTSWGIRRNHQRRTERSKFTDEILANRRKSVLGDYKKQFPRLDWIPMRPTWIFTTSGRKDWTWVWSVTNGRIYWRWVSGPLGGKPVSGRQGYTSLDSGEDLTH